MRKSEREKQKAEDFIQKLLDGAKRVADMPEDERPQGCVQVSRHVCTPDDPCTACNSM